MRRLNPKPKRTNWTTVKGAKVTPKRERKRVRGQSATQRKRMRRYKPIRDKFLADHPHCQVCIKVCEELRKAGVPGHYDIDASEDLHHRKGRIGELLFDTRFFLATCRQHHDQIHRAPNWALREGWNLPRLTKDV